MPNEQLISSWKNLYQLMLPLKASRYSTLTKLKILLDQYEPIIKKLKADKPFSTGNLDLLNKDINDFLNATFPAAFIKQYKSVPPEPVPPLVSTGNQNADNFLNLARVIGSLSRNHTEGKVHKNVYQCDFLKNAYDCLNNCGLHDEIAKRDASKCKRYNAIVEYALGKKDTGTEAILLLPYEKLQAGFISPYLTEKNILINGRKISPKQTIRLTITTTLLKDDEVNNFKSLKRAQTDEGFASVCTDETNLLLEEWQLKNKTSLSKAEDEVPFYGKLLENLNISSIVLDAFFSLVPQPRDRSQVSASYVGKLHHHNCPFQMKVYGAFPLMSDWKWLEHKMGNGHFNQYNLAQSEIEDYLKKYGEAFIDGYFSFEKDIVNKNAHLFNEPSDRQQVIFDYATGRFFKGTGFPESHGKNVHVLSSWQKVGKEAGYFYRAWYIILEHSKRFEPFFKTPVVPLPNEFIKKVLEGLRTLQTIDEAEHFILQAKKGKKKDEAAFRNWFRAFFSSLYDVVEAEPVKGNGRIDLKIIDKKTGTVILEFKGWWNSDVKTITEQLYNYLTDFDDTGYIILINHLKTKDIIQDYERIICGEGTSYKPGSWEEIEFQNTGYKFYKSQHRYGNKYKTIYHFIYRLFP